MFRWVDQDKIDRRVLAGDAGVRAGTAGAARRQIAELGGQLVPDRRASVLSGNAACAPKKIFPVVAALTR